MTLSYLIFIDPKCITVMQTNYDTGLFDYMLGLVGGVLVIIMHVQCVQGL